MPGTKNLVHHSLSQSNPFLDLKHLKHTLPPNCLSVFPDFIPEQQAQTLVSQSHDKLRRLFGKEYQQKHFDSVIWGYRECTVSSWALPSQEPAALLFKQLIREEGTLPTDSAHWLPPHILDLKDSQSGILKHVDHLTASGSVIMGLCLISPAVMVFRHVKDPGSYFSALLPKNCAYIQRDQLRYDFTHELLAGTEHIFKGKLIPRERRICLLLRDRYRPEGQPV